VSEVVERAEVAARPGAVWQIVREIPGRDTTRTPRIDTANEPRELAWTSMMSLADGETAERDVEVHSWFRLAPNWTGTEVEYGVRFPDVLEAAEDAAVRRRLITQLVSVKARAESTA
jgi:hypothetical protein